MRNRSLKPYLMILCMLLAVAMASGPAHATVTTYTNRAAWEAALDGVVTDTLESTALGNFPTPLALSGGVLLTSLSADPVTIQVFDNGILGSRELHFRDFTSGVQFSLAANGNAFGFDYRAPEAWVLAANGKSVPLQVSVSGFIGFIDDAGPIESFSLTGAAGAQGGISVDNLSRIGTVFSGLPSVKMGTARISRSPSGSLVVSNLQDSEEDGVRLNLGQSAGWSMDFAPFMDVTQAGMVLESSMRGRVDGIDDKVIGKSRIEGTGSSALLSVDYSSIGSLTSSVELFGARGESIGRFTIPNGAVIRIGDSTKANWFLDGLRWLCEKLMSDGYRIAASGPVEVNGPGGQRVDGVFSLEVFALNITAAREYVSVGTLTAEGFGSIGIAREAVQVHDSFEHALGNAILEPVNGNLRVANIGTTGNDGVSFEIDAAQEARVSLDPIGLSEPLAKGAFLEARASSPSGQSLGGLRITNSGAGLEIAADFSPLGSSTQRIEIYKDGAQAAVVNGHAGTAARINTVVIWPQSVAATTGSGGSLPAYSITLPQDVQLTIPDGPTVVGDEIRILAENSLTAIDNLSGIAVQASGIPEITVVGVQAVSCAPVITTQPSSISTAAGKPIRFTVAASGQGPLQYQWRRNGVDLVDGGNLAGAESDTLTLTPVLPRDTGRYEVVVSNACGSVVSSTVTYRPAGSLRGLLRGLRMEVSELVSAGSLSPGQGSVLVTRLNRTQREITLGRIASAASRLRLFVDKVNFYASTGVLTPAEAAPLIDGANGLIGFLTS